MNKAGLKNGKMMTWRWEGLGREGSKAMEIYMYVSISSIQIVIPPFDS